MTQHLLPAMRHISGETFIFQEDSAPAHRAPETIELLPHRTPNFIGPEMWLPNSPDLNPVDYSVCWLWKSAYTVYQQRIQNTDELRQRLVAVWKDLEQHIVDTAIDR